MKAKMLLQKSFLFSCMIGLVSVSAWAQTSQLSGAVHTSDGQPLGYANVVIQNVSDSAFVNFELTHDDGTFMITNVPSGEYFMSVNYAGLPAYYGEPFLLAEGETKELGTILMHPAANNLQEVMVTAQRPIVELKNDRTVFNVQGSINATGYNGLELLRKSPGVLVDNNNNISILGKSGVVVYIDGRQSPLNGQELASYLESLQSTQIDAIEVITSPSSKYDAQGNAGIINIKLVRSDDFGTNGNASLEYRQGRYGSTNGSLTLNRRTKGINLYGTIGGNINEGYNTMNFDRRIESTTQASESFGKNNRDGANLRFGVDLFISDRSTLGFLTTNDWSSGDRSQNGLTKIGEVGEGQYTQLLLSTNENKYTRQNNQFNLNYSLDLGEQHNLNVDVDYGYYDSDVQDDQPNRYLDSERNFVRDANYFTESPSTIDIITIKADYERPMAGGKLSLGAKSSMVTTDNDFRFFNVVDGDRIPSLENTNQFIYDENVFAAYFNFSRSLGEQLSLQLGLRAEQTESEGELIALDDKQNNTVSRSYLDWFPSMGLSYQMDAKNSFNLSYSRRLNRPSYQDLNPFLFRLDELSFQRGNPFLNPEYSNSIQLTHSYNYKLSTTFSYTRTTDIISRVLDRDQRMEGAAFISWFNLDEQDHWSLSLSTPTAVTDWWNSFINMTAYHIQNRSSGFSESGDIDISVNAFNIYAQQTFTIDPTTTIELSGWYNSPAIWEGNFETESMGSVDIGVQKRFFDNKLNVKLTATDIFKTNPWAGETQLGDVFYMRMDGEWDSRQFKVALNYKFGNDKIKTRRRKTGLEDEQSRIKS